MKFEFVNKHSSNNPNQQQHNIEQIMTNSENSGMEEPQRAVSANNSRRRRWEVKSKESFETSIAIEIDSPQKNATRKPSAASKKDSPHTNEVSVKGKNTKSHSNCTGDQSKPSSESSSRMSSKPASAKASSQRPGSVKSSKSKLSSGKSVLTSKSVKSNDADLLSAKLGALIDEANVKNKESQKRIPKTRETEQLLKADIDDEVEKSSEKSVDSTDMPETGKEKNMETDLEEKYIKEKDTEDHSPNPSAPPLSPGPEEQTKVKKHKKKSESKILMMNTKNEESFITLQLKELKDDIVDLKNNRASVIAAPVLLNPGSFPMVNGNISAIFEEKGGGFVMARCNGDGIQKLSERLHDVAQVQTRTSYAVFLQGGFRTFSVLSQGLLAGLTLAHCLVIFLLDADAYDMLTLYHERMAHVFHALIMFLTTICFVSSCDRCDLIGAGVVTGHGIKVPWTSAFYLSSLVLSLVAVRTEDVLTHRGLYDETIQMEMVEELILWWRWICVARSSSAVLGWLAVVPDPHTDALLDSIQELHRK